jgi:hypothetical protein
MHKAWEKFAHHFIPSHHNAYRPHILRKPWLLFFLAVILAAEGFLVANLAVRQSSDVFLAAVFPSAIVSLTNTERTRHSAPLLIEDAQLTHAAQAKAEDMAARGYFSHTGPDGQEPWIWILGAGYDYRFAGENLAVRFVDSSDVLEAWMDSPSHRANILKPAYSAIGVGVAQGVYEGQPATYVVQYFASPMQQGAAVTSADAPHVNLPGQLVRMMGEPRSTTFWILMGVASVLLVAVLLGFFIHIHIQPVALLMGGALVALFALSLTTVNTHFLKTTATPAAALRASDALQVGVVVSEVAASTAR